MQPSIIQCPACGASLQNKGLSPLQTTAPCPYCQHPVPLTEHPPARGVASKLSENNWLPWAMGIGAVVGLSLCVIGVAILVRLGASPPVRTSGDVDHSETTSQPSASTPPGATAPLQRATGLRAETLPRPDPADYEFFDATSGVINPPELRYRWEVGKPYAFRFSFSATVDGAVIRSTGMNVFVPKAASSVGAGSSETAEGSGTGFVVTPDGHMVTCAHVVEGATEIEVKLGEATYTASVLVMDRENDVALIHVPANGLPVLPLADSDRVELAQEIRAIGYPLSTLLGNSVKVTRGSISGILRNDDGDLFQVDCSINPGNSGGPLVNQRGEVVGVATAKLTGDDVTNVGFGVPSNKVKQLLRVKQLSYTRRGAAADLDGPALARRVTPAVGFIRVTVAPGGVGMAKPTTLEFTGYTTSGSRPVGSQHDPSVSTSGLTTEKVSGQMILGEYGEIVRVSENAGMGSNGAMGQSMFVGLSSTGDTHWETKRPLLVPELQADTPGNSLGYRGRNYHLHRPAPRVRAVMHPAIERIVRTVGDTSGNQVVIQTEHAVTTLQGPGETPYFQLDGRGTTTFDKSLGVPVAMEYEATLTRQIGGRTIRIPVKVTYSMVDPADASRLIASARATGGGSRESVRGSDALEASTLDEILAALRTTEIAEMTFYRDKLAELLSHIKVPEDRRQEVEEVLSAIVAKESRSRISDGVALAVAKWGSDQDAIAMANRIGAVDASMRQVLIKRLRGIGTEESARVLGAIVSYYHDANASAALQAMGPVAEDAAIFLLNDPDVVDRMEGCRILGVVGGQPSITALSKLLRLERNQVGKDAVKAALRKIRLRPDESG